MKFYQVAGLFLVTFIIFSGCKSPALLTSSPGESYIPVDIKPEPSNFLITLNIQVKDLETLLNQKVNGLLYADTSLDNNNRDNLMLKVWKKDSFTISLRGNELSYRVPLKIWAKAGFRYEKFGISLSDFRDFNGEIALKLRTRFSINADWTITTKTNSDGYEWIKKPTVRIAGMDMPITFIVDAVLMFSPEAISESIDEAVASGFDVQSLFAKTWKDIQKPMLLSEDYRLWLKITPLELSTPFISSYDNRLQQKIFIKATAETSIGKEPKYIINTKLPPLKLENPAADQFEINLMNEIPFTEADSLANRFLTGKSFSSGKKSITITGIRIFGSQGKMVAETNVKGSVNGKLYFTGIPYFDNADSTLKLRDFDFDIKTRNVLIGSANWLLNSKIDRMIRKQFMYPLASDLKTLKSELEIGLNDQDLGMGFKTSSTLNEFTIKDVFLTSEAIKFSLLFKGSLKITSENFYKKR